MAALVIQSLLEVWLGCSCGYECIIYEIDMSHLESKSQILYATAQLYWRERKNASNYLVEKKVLHNLHFTCCVLDRVESRVHYILALQSTWREFSFGNVEVLLLRGEGHSKKISEDGACTPQKFWFFQVTPFDS